MSRKKAKRFVGCRGKVRYATWQEALAAQPQQNAYLCTRCGCWHLTTK